MNNPKVTLDQWLILQAVGEEGGFQAAADRLHKSQSTVSYAIHQLQDKLGVELFEYRGRRAQLTESGEMILRRASALIEQAGTLERAATDLALQTLNLERLVQVSPAQIAQLPAAIHPRVRHVTTENERVLAAVAALKGDQPEIFARLMNAAHASMRDDFAASHDDVDAQVAAALRAGAMGARITGAGFGGCYVALSRPDKAADICADLLAQFPFAKRVA